MPKYLEHVLIWEEAELRYQLQSSGRPKQWYSRCGDEGAFSCWLDEHTAFAFVGQHGRLSVLKEARRGNREYWYASRTHHRQTQKRYLGPSEKVTFARLEEVAQVLAGPPALNSSFLPSSRLPREGVLGVKLSPPRLPLAVVERSRLFAALDAALAYPLTLVSAPAGSGKTTLLAAWVSTFAKRASGGSAAGAAPALAWLSLEELDNDPIRFWTSCIVALRTCLPSVGEMALAMLHAQESLPLATCLISLLQEIEQVDQEILLILDDYHVIAEQTITQSMHFLLEHMPANLHLLLAGRTDPELPLARLRARAHLLEFRDPELQFTRAEASSFLVEGMALPLSEDEVTALHRRTEGWIAGLQLAALSLKKRDDPSAWVRHIAGGHRYLLDYVQQDILARLPLSLQHFLLQTSILTRMNASLCQAVLVEPTYTASQQVLEDLVHANLFVVPLDDEREWYRYHELFREALLARLQASQPDVVPSLHLRAARWHEAQEEWRKAIAHALDAPDYPLAASFIEQAAPKCWLSGDANLVLNWILCLPDIVLRAHIHLALNATFRFLNPVQALPQTVQVRVVAQVEQVFSRLEEFVRRRSEYKLSATEVALIRRRVRLLRALIQGWEMHKRGDETSLRQLAQEIKALPPDEERSWNLISLTFIFWLTHAYQREAGLLLPKLLAAKRQVKEAGDQLATLRVMHMLAAAYTDAGKLYQVYRECTEGLALIDQMGGHTTLEGYFHIYLSFVYYSWNQLKEVSDSLNKVRRIAQAWQEVDLRVMGETTWAWLSLARGDLSEAEHAVRLVEELVAQERYAFHGPWLIYARVPWWLARGDLTRASEWAAETALSEENWHPTRKWEALLRVRIALAERQYTFAMEMLSHFSSCLDRPGDIYTTTSYLALQVVALYQAGKNELAIRNATRLLSITEPEGYIRVYLDAGAPMKQVLQALLASADAKSQDGSPDKEDRASSLVVSRSYLRQLLQAFEEEKQRGTPLSDEQPANVQKALPSLPSLLREATSCTPYEPLTPQELRVLQLLAMGHSNQEIANALVVSLNTVKSHLKHLYSKLSVSSRIQASTRARDLHLL